MDPVTLGVIAKYAGLFAYALLEYWLGKTDKVKAGSAIEAVLNTAKKVLKPKVKI